MRRSKIGELNFSHKQGTFLLRKLCLCMSGWQVVHPCEFKPDLSVLCAAMCICITNIVGTIGTKRKPP